MRVNKYVSGAVRQFAYWFAHGTLGYPILEGIDYTGEIMREESSFVEQAFAIFVNNLEYDEHGVTNYKYCENRAAEYIRSYFDRDYTVSPAFSDRETALHDVSGNNFNK